MYAYAGGDPVNGSDPTGLIHSRKEPDKTAKCINGGCTSGFNTGVGDSAGGNFVVTGKRKCVVGTACFATMAAFANDFRNGIGPGSTSEPLSYTILGGGAGGGNGGEGDKKKEDEDWTCPGFIPGP
jgi:hypothetical protein